MSSLKVVPTEPDRDLPKLISWLLQPGVLQYFPLVNEREVEDAARIWIAYAKIGACWTALYDEEPCGIANLYISPYKKLAKQSLLAIVVDEPMRGKGVGTALLEELLLQGKEKFHLHLLHLEVYEGNPAYRLYERMGFSRYGSHPYFLQEKGEYWTKVLMQKKL